MKICFMSDADSIHTRKWVNYFADKEHEVHLITSTPGDGYSRSIQIHELTVPVPQKAWVIFRAFNALVRIIKARRLIRKIKPDVINAHFITTNGFLGAISGIHPLVLTAWGSDILISPKTNPYNRFLTKYALKRADLVTCNSKTLRHGLELLGVNQKDIRVIDNGTDTKMFSPRSRSQTLKRPAPKPATVVISTRSLRQIYNVEMLIRTIPLVLKHTTGIFFMIIGDGNEREHLENLAGSLGISENVRFTGKVTHEELPGYLASADIYVSTSRSDSSSLSLQEAMACELAPVITDLSGNREWVENGKNGFLVPIDDIESLAERIIRLHNDKNLREQFGKAARKLINDKAEYSKEMDKLEKLLIETVKSHTISGRHKSKKQD